MVQAYWHLIAECCAFFAQGQHVIARFYPIAHACALRMVHCLLMDRWHAMQLLSWGWNARATLGHGHMYALPILATRITPCLQP